VVEVLTSLRWFRLSHGLLETGVVACSSFGGNGGSGSLLCGNVFLCRRLSESGLVRTVDGFE
jgi:hypothetical protein